MKIISVVSLLLFIAPFSWGSEILFAFFRDHELGSRVSAGNEGINELPALEVLGYQFAAYRELDEDKSIRSAGLYLRSNTSDVPVADLERVFAEMNTVISVECGEAAVFEVPNFEDATERTHLMRAWKDENSILVLQKFESPGRLEVDVRHVDLEHFTSNLGADSGSFVFSQLETKAGELSIPESAASDRNREADTSAVEQDQEVEFELGREPGLAGREKSAQPRPTSQNEKSDAPPWPFVIGAIALLGVLALIVRGFFRGRSS